jgi:FKBP-type peptidyl-prolyl cis-trans isomerase
MKLQMYYTKIQAEITKKTKEEGEKFLADNKTKSGVITLASGLQYQVIKEGTGPQPDSSDVVSTKYVGTTIGGKVLILLTETVAQLNLVLLRLFLVGLKLY